MWCQHKTVTTRSSPPMTANTPWRRHSHGDMEWRQHPNANLGMGPEGENLSAREHGRRQAARRQGARAPSRRRDGRGGGDNRSHGANHQALDAAPMMARDIARSLDPSLLGSDVGLMLDSWQARALMPHSLCQLLAKAAIAASRVGAVCRGSHPRDFERTAA